MCAFLPHRFSLVARIERIYRGLNISIPPRDDYGRAITSPSESGCVYFMLFPSFVSIRIRLLDLAFSHVEDSKIAISFRIDTGT